MGIVTKLRRIAGAAVAIPLLAFASGASAEPLKMVTWGGVWQKTFQQIAADYQAKTGQEVAVTAQGSTDAMLARLIAQRDKPEFDIWTPNMINYVRAVRAGILEPMASVKIDQPGIASRYKLSHGVVTWISQRGIFYRKDLAPFEITGWKDLWDPRLKGKLGQPAAQFDAGYWPLAAAVAFGGDLNNLEPGWKALAALKPNTAAFYTNNVQSVRMLEAGEIAVVGWGVLPNIIPYLGPDSKYRFVIPTPSFVAETPVSMLKGSKNIEAAGRFIDYILSPDVQTKLAAAFGSTPANSKAETPALITSLGFDPAKAYPVDYGALADKLDAILDRYEREVMVR